MAGLHLRRKQTLMDLWYNITAWIAGNWHALAGYGATLVILVSQVTANSQRMRLMTAFAATSAPPRQDLKNGCRRIAPGCGQWFLEL